ncbi:MAG TPA: hypothetical protein VGR41_05465 [Actinomycetota bacterium]|jgi:hypothetical protein|nr:hypothetical protein [Actinomycetota bacterium]
MVNRKDHVLEALRRANPAPDESTSGWHASPEGVRVAARARTEEPARPEDPMRRRPHRVAIGLIAAVAAAFGIAAAFALGSSDTLTPNIAKCHSVLRQESSAVAVGLLGRDPIDACIQEWERTGQRVPPRLTACVIDEGGTGVFPYPEGMTPAGACSSISARVFEPDPTEP